jgi:hypothetical protein
MRRTVLERRVRVLEGRIASLETSFPADFGRVDARTEAELAFEHCQHVFKVVRWGSTVVAGASFFGAVLTYALT